MSEQASYYCLQCKSMRLFVRNGPNHILHLLITLLLCGFWLPVWLVITLTGDSKPFFCSVCGYADAPANLADPRTAERRLIQGKDSRPNALVTWVVNEQNTWKLATIMLGVMVTVAGIVYLSSR